MSIPARLVLATGNAGKLREMREILAPWQVDVRSLAEFTPESAAETGLTFVENALLKARHACLQTGLPALADDSGLVVDALDLCYTKQHVDSFVIVSGDSDFSPLVSKLRENDKLVIGVGVKNSTSDLLIANCDDFIFYDDLVRESAAKKPRVRRNAPKSGADKQAKGSQKENGEDVRKQLAMDLMLETVEALIAERGEEDKIWGSMVKQALKRRKPGFSESYYGFRSFSRMLEEARDNNLMKLEYDEKSGGYIIKGVVHED